MSDIIYNFQNIQLVNTVGVSGSEGFWFSDNGLRLWTTSGSTVFEYNLSVAFDVSTLSSTGRTLNIGAQQTNNRGLWFSPNGNRLFVSGLNPQAVFEYDLSVAFDITTAVYNGVSLSTGVADTSDIFFKSDGLQMYIAHAGGVRQYALTEAYNLSTAELFVNANIGRATDVFIKDDGTKLWITNPLTNLVRQFTLTTPFNVSSAVYDDFDINSGFTSFLGGFWISPTAGKFYLIFAGPSTLYEYNFEVIYPSTTTTTTLPPEPEPEPIPGLINLDELFTSLGIVGGNNNSKSQYDFYKGIIWSDGEITNTQYDFFKKIGLSRYDFFKQFINEREFYRSIAKPGSPEQLDPRIYDFKTFYEHAGEFLSSPDWILKYAAWNDGGAWFDNEVWID